MVVETGAGLQGGSSTTVRVLLEQFMTTAKLSATTTQDWWSVINHHLVPGLGDIALWKLTARDCDQLYTKMAAAGLGSWRVRCAHVVLHRAFAQAVRWGWLSRNPVSAATRPEVPRTVITPPNTAQIRRMLSAAEDNDQLLACWLHVAVATGARRGEICALRWGDVDVERATVRIERSVAATKQAGIAFKSTKTGGVRLVSLTSQALSALRRHRDLTERRAVPVRRQVEPADLIFTNDPYGQRPLRPELITRRWERLRQSTGLGHVRIHDIRHFVATELLTSGIDVRTVSNRLGHAVHPPRLTSTGPGCPPETATPRSTSKPSSDQADPHSWATQAGIRPITGDMMPTREAVAEGVLRGAREGPI
jgi:integrase